MIYGGSLRVVRTWAASLASAGREGERALSSVPGASLTHLSRLFLFQFLFIVLTDYKKKQCRMDTFPFFFFSFCSFLFFSKWVIVKQFMYSLSACVFIGGSELGLKPSPEVVFQTWKEAPIAQAPSLTLSPSFSFFLSLTHTYTTSHSLSVSIVVTLWRCYLHIISYYFIGSQSCQKTPSWNIQQA